MLQGNRSFSYYHVPENSEVILRPLVKESDLRIRRPRVFHRKHINRKTPLELAREHVERKRREQERLKYFNRDRANNSDDFSEDRNTPYTDFYLRDHTDDDDDDEDERDGSKAKGLDAMEGGITWHMSRNKDENLKPSALTTERKRPHFNSRPWNNPNSSTASISSLSSAPSFSQMPAPFVKPEPKNYDSYEKSLLEDVDDDDDDDDEGREKRPKKKARVKPQRDGGRPTYQNKDPSTTQFHRNQQTSFNNYNNNNNNNNNHNNTGNYFNPRTSSSQYNNNSQPTPQNHYSHYSDRNQPYSRQQQHHHHYLHRPRSSSRDRDRQRR